MSNSMTITAVVQDDTSFLDDKDKLQLSKLSKELAKASKEAIETLLNLLESKDERVRMQVAFKLLEYEIDVKKALSQDQMQRLIAEIKLIRGSNSTKQLTAEEEKKKPVVDFGRIREV